jgi:hypothetical protein
VRRLLVAAVVVAVVAVVAGLVVWRTGSEPTVTRGGVVPAEGDAFDGGGKIEPGPFRGAWSPNATHVLTVSAQGVGEPRRGRVRLITPAGSRAVDAAWFPGSNAVLIAEGPIPTGQLSVLRLDGSSLGNVTLTPSFGVGGGRGMTVDATGRRAVVTRVERDPFHPGERTDLVMVDLRTGASRPLVETGDVDEDRPFFVGPELVVFTTRPAAGGDAAVAELDVATNKVRLLSPEGEDATGIGTIGSGAWVAYTSGTTLWATRRDGGGEPVRLADVASGATVVAVEPDGRAALVAEPTPGGATRLRRITTRSLPSAGRSGREGYGGSPWRSTFS